MTLSATVAVNRYTAAEGQTVFPYSFKILDDDHMQVFEGDSEITSGFTVSGVGSSDGGNVTFTTAPRLAGEAAVTITLKRAVPLDQVVDLPAAGALSSVSLEESGLDRIVMQLQQLDEEKQRAVLLAVSSTLTGLTISPAASSLIGWNAAADALINYASAAIAADVVPTGYMETVLAAANAGEALALLDADGLAPAAADKGRLPLASGAGAFDLVDPADDVNVLLNGAMRVWPQGASFTAATTPANNDDTYTAEGWILLSQSNDTADVSQQADAATAEKALRLDIETTGNKVGIAQVVENAEIAPLLVAGTCSLSFQAKITGSSIDSVKAAVVAWNDAADTVTSDLVLAWGAAGVNPTLNAGWTYENVPSVLAVDTGWTTFKIEGVALDTASTSNIAVFIWIDQTDATVGDLLDIRRVKLQPGSIATAFRAPDAAAELLRCRRYFQRYAGTGHGMAGTCRSTTTGLVAFRFDAPMRAAPSLAYSAAAALNCIDDSGTGNDSSAIALSAAAVSGVTLNLTIGAANFTDGHGLFAELKSGQYLEFSARL